MTQLLSPDVELRWQAWQARGVDDTRRRGLRMGALVLALAAALSVALLFQFI
jgi:hypothetical protein